MMTPEQRDFLLAEFKSAWEMVLKIDDRRGIFARYYAILFLGVLSVVLTIISQLREMKFVVGLGLIAILAFTIKAGSLTKGILRSEREANIRYRMKINLIRELFLGGSNDESIKKYLTFPQLGIKLLSNEPAQPKGDGRTLTPVYRMISLQQITCVAFIIGILILWLLDQSAVRECLIGIMN